MSRSSDRASANQFNKYSTTYNASYRPYDANSQRVRIICLPSSIMTNDLNSGSRVVPSGSINPARWCRSYGQSSVANSTFPSSLSASSNTPTNRSPANDNLAIGQSDFRRSWNEVDSNGDRQRTHLLKPSCLLPTGAVPTVPNSLPSDISNQHSFRQFTSTYTTTVPEKCPIGSSIVSNAGKAKSDSSPYYERAIDSKSSTVTATPRASPNPDRFLTLSPIAPHQLVSKFDFGQMFSQIARINDHLYLSSLNALTPDRLRQHRITLLISAMIDPPPIGIRNAVSNYVHVVVEDMDGANIRVHFDRVTDRIASENRRGGRSLIHCIAGVSRSSTLIMAYLMRHLGMSLADAYEHVRSIRPCIQPNPSFWRQLMEYEERIRGSRSVRLTPSLSQGSSCANNPSRDCRVPTSSIESRSSFMDMFSRTNGDILPYRPLARTHPIDSRKPYIGCRQSLG